MQNSSVDEYAGVAQLRRGSKGKGRMMRRVSASQSSIVRYFHIIRKIKCRRRANNWEEDHELRLVKVLSDIHMLVCEFTLCGYYSVLRKKTCTNPVARQSRQPW
jgi:hypothetical protein